MVMGMVVKVTLLSFLLMVCTGSVGWAADYIDWTKPYARMNAGVVGGGAAAATCSTDVSVNQTIGGYDNFGSSTNQYIGYLFTTGAGVTSATMVAVKLKRSSDNANSDTITGYIYTNSSSKPGSLVTNATSSNTHSWNDLNSSTETVIKFCFSSVTLSAETSYFFVMKRSATNDVDLFQWGYASSGSNSTVAWGTDGTNWSNYTPTTHSLVTSYGTCSCP